MISNEILKVSKTKILVGLNYNKTKQIIIYSNFIDNLSESNAMILPVPLPETVEFINLSKYENLFEDCEKCFYNNTRSTRKCDSSSNNILEIFNVGSYKVSLAKNLKEINNVNSNIFKLSKGLKKILEKYYYQEYWGFIICKLDEGAENWIFT